MNSFDNVQCEEKYEEKPVLTVNDDDSEFAQMFAKLCQDRAEAKARGEYIKPIDLDSENPFGIPYVRESAKIGRNDACPCGSGKKFKKCCEGK